MIKILWTSKEEYQHPVNVELTGLVCRTSTGIYVMRVEGARFSCPQKWASEIHAKELKEIKNSEPSVGRPQIGDAQLTALRVPASLQSALKKSAKARGLSLPDARREAYSMWINSK